MRFPHRPKIRSVPSLENMLNVDNRVHDPVLWLMLTEQEKYFLSGFTMCRDTEQVVGDVKLETEKDILQFKHGMGLIVMT